MYSWVGEGIAFGWGPFISPAEVSLSKIFDPNELSCEAEPSSDGRRATEMPMGISGASL